MATHIFPRFLPLAATLLTLACHRQVSEGTLASSQPEKAAPASAEELRFAVIGDFGTGERDEMEVAHMVAAWKPEFVITVGDNNTPDGAPSDLEGHVAAAYAQFIPGDHGAYGNGPKEPRFFPALGNHDWRTSFGLKPYADFFRVPQAPANGRYYEALLGDGRVQLFSLDSDPHEPDGNTPDSKQAQWLKSRAAAAGNACLRLVAFHHPAYSSAMHGSTKEMRWPFRALGIDAVLTGHDHTYERLEVDGIPYFVDGLGGADLYAFRTELPESKVRYNQAHGAMLVTVAPQETRFEEWSVTGVKVDSYALAKPCPVAAR